MTQTTKRCPCCSGTGYDCNDRDCADCNGTGKITEEHYRQIIPSTQTTKPNAVLWTRRAHVLKDGHVDHITGPRCMVQMDEGPDYGLYFIAHTKEVLKEGAPVIFDWRHNAEVLA